MSKNFSNWVNYKTQEFKQKRYKIPDSYKEGFKKLGLPKEWYMYFLYCFQFWGFKLQSDADIPDYFVQYLEIKKERWWIKVSPKESLLFSFQAIQRELLEVDFSRVWKFYSDKDNFGGEQYQVSHFEETWCNYLGFTREQVEAILAFVKRFNNFTQKHTRITAPSLTNGLAPQFLLQYFYNFYSNPFFKVSFKSWWRIYAQWLWSVKGNSYQSLKWVHRRQISLNWEKVKEFDIKSSMLQFFIILCKNYGINLDNNFTKWVEVEDPYNFINNEYFQWINILDSWESREVSFTRDEIKDLVLRILYNDKEKRERSIKYYLGKQKHISNAILNNMSDFIAKVDELIGKLAWKMPLYRAITYEESKFFYALAESLMKDEVPLLPIHDSYLVWESNFPTLKQKIEEISNEKYWKPLQYKEK